MENNPATCRREVNSIFSFSADSGIHTHNLFERSESSYDLFAIRTTALFLLSLFSSLNTNSFMFVPCLRESN